MFKKVKMLKDAEENFTLTLKLSVCCWDDTQDKIFCSIPAIMTSVHSFIHWASILYQAKCIPGTRNTNVKQHFRSSPNPLPIVSHLLIHISYGTTLTVLKCIFHCITPLDQILLWHRPLLFYGLSLSIFLYKPISPCSWSFTVPQVCLALCCYNLIELALRRGLNVYFCTIPCLGLTHSHDWELLVNKIRDLALVF